MSLAVDAAMDMLHHGELTDEDRRELALRLMTNTGASHVVALQSRDDLKRDLEITCEDCNSVLADVEPGDDMLVLARVALLHLSACDGIPTQED